jgi:CheY-like chemotaxis protein
MGPSVLIVEDEAELGLLLSDVLRSAGFEVTLTRSGRAVERAVTLNPAVVVTDYMMPAMNGAEVIKKIRVALGQQAPPVVLVTGMDNPLILATELDAAAVLSKPFDMDVFVQTVQRVAEGADER